MQDTQVVDGNQTDPGAAVLKCAAQAPVPRVGKNTVNQRGGDEDGMARLSANGRAGQLCIRVQQRAHRRRSKQRNIHRGKQQTVALVLQVTQADPHRIEHLGCPVFLIAQKDDAVAAEMPLQQNGVIAGDHDDLLYTRLLEGSHHPLSDGDGADIQQRFEVPHA